MTPPCRYIVVDAENRARASRSPPNHHYVDLRRYLTSPLCRGFCSNQQRCTQHWSAQCTGDQLLEVTSSSSWHRLRQTVTATPLHLPLRGTCQRRGAASTARRRSRSTSTSITNNDGIGGSDGARNSQVPCADVHATVGSFSQYDRRDVPTALLGQCTALQAASRRPGDRD